MPKAIEELVHGGQEPLSGHFKRDFDTKRNQIIYHGHVEPKKVIPFFEDLKKIGHHEIESEGQKSHLVKSGVSLNIRAVCIQRALCFCLGFVMNVYIQCVVETLYVLEDCEN